MRILLINFLFFLFFSGYSQNVNEIINQAQSSGISSEEDILRELERRGMTVQDAQRMALIYGIDYNEYISQFITGTEEFSAKLFISSCVLVLIMIRSTIPESTLAVSDISSPLFN